MMNGLHIWRIIIVVSLAVSVNKSPFNVRAQILLLAHSGVFIARIFFLIIELGVEVSLIGRNITNVYASLFNDRGIDMDLEVLTKRIIKISLSIHYLLFFLVTSTFIIAISTI